MNRILIAGTNSGCGKTTITCAVLQALVNRGLRVSSFKCGPDYIDPMFHSTVIGTKSRNLDACFCKKETLNYLLWKHAATSDIAVLEGVMGYYDGVGTSASSHQTAMDTGTPTVLVIDCRGMSRSIGAVMKGYLEFCAPSGIRGIIFNRLPQSLTALAKSFCSENGVAYLGAFPNRPDLQIESRHLGLVTAAEISDLKERMQTLAAEAEAHLDLDALLALARTAADAVEPASGINTLQKEAQDDRHTDAAPVIAVARDRAFCFYYEDNLDLLREFGARIVSFSPLADACLPDDIDGLYLGGGYPELYLEQLSEKKGMLADIRKRVCSGLPTIAECGGFLYLHTALQDAATKGDQMPWNVLSGRKQDAHCHSNCSSYAMAGVIDGTAFQTPHLQRFGYVELTAQTDNMLCRKGETFRAHEFHYWESTSCGAAFTAKKLSNGVTYPCVHANRTLYAGFPHLYFYTNPKLAARFVSACSAYAKGHHSQAANS